MRRLVVLTFLVTMLTVSAFPAGADETVSDDAVFNGGFEIAAHHVRPTVCEVFGEGDIRVFEPDNPADLPWVLSVNPCHSSSLKATSWSSGRTVDVDDFDNDGDRETRFIAGPNDPVLGNHNLWQAYPNPHQAYVANFTALEFDVESGSVPAGAVVRLSLSTTPLTNPTPWVGLFVECNLVFRSAQLQPDADGRVSVDPTEGSLSSAYVDCNDAAAAWQGASADERREILDGLRLVQHSYWNWNSGSEDVVIDNVSMVGSRTAAEALLS